MGIPSPEAEQFGKRMAEMMDRMLDKVTVLVRSTSPEARAAYQKRIQSANEAYEG